MEIDFTPQELLFVYGRFKLKLQELEALKAKSNSPIATETLNSDIKLYSSITKKLSDCDPNLLKMDPYLKKLKQ
nr:hypothetical protein [uncultured Agathobacter sp.]